MAKYTCCSCGLHAHTDKSNPCNHCTYLPLRSSGRHASREGGRKASKQAVCISAFLVIPSRALLSSPPLCPIWSVRVHLLSSSFSLYECERGKITLARFSWGFPPPFLLQISIHSAGREGERERERESSLYVTGGGAVTAKANPNSLLLRHRSITVSVTASEVRPSEVGSMQKTFPPDLRKKEGSSERERERERAREDIES